MKTIKCKLTVYFAEPFWVGVFERICDGKLSVAKVTFGAEPKDYDIQEFVLKHYYDLQFSPAVETIVKKDKKNPKRVLRDVKKQLQNNGIGTKSQQALKLQHELKKEEYKSNSKHKKQMDAEQKKNFFLIERTINKKKRFTPNRLKRWKKRKRKV